MQHVDSIPQCLKSRALVSRKPGSRLHLPIYWLYCLVLASSPKVTDSELLNRHQKSGSVDESACTGMRSLDWNSSTHIKSQHERVYLLPPCWGSLTCQPNQKNNPKFSERHYLKRIRQKVIEIASLFFWPLQTPLCIHIPTYMCTHIYTTCAHTTF